MTVDQYIDAAPEPQQSTLRQMRSMLARILPDAEEVIHYGVPTLKVDGVYLVGYGHAKNHCSFFPYSGRLLGRVKPRLLEGYDVGKGTLRFPADQPLPESLVRHLVKMRLAMIDK